MIVDVVDVVDLEASRAFYERALEPLGIATVMELDGRTAFGPESGRPQFWLVARDDSSTTGVHIAVAASNPEAVDAFHRAAVAAGGRDTAPRASGPSITRPTTEPSSSTPTATHIEAVYGSEF